MGFSLDTLTADKVRLTIVPRPKFPDEKVTFSYRPGEITPATMNELSANASEENLSYIVEQIVRFVDSWDVKWHEDDEDSIPITSDNLSRMPLSFLLAIVNAIGKDQAGPDPKAKR